MIPLSEVAEDARRMIAEFRAAESVSFQDRPVAEARAEYRSACRANGVVSRGAQTVFGVRVAGVPCRVYRPSESRRSTAEPEKPGGALLFLHGGGWVIGDLESHDPLCRALATGTGCTVIAVDYRRAPEHPFPAAHEDAIAVAAALLDGAPLGADGRPLVDPSRIALVGDSAGGNLAAWIAGEAARGRFAHRPLAQVLFYPVVDLSCSRESYARITEGFPLTAASMRWFAAQYVPRAEDRGRRELSPLRHELTAGQAPSFIATVGLDPLADEGVAYALALADAGARVEHHHLPRHAHGLMTSAGRIGSGRWLLDRACAFLGSRFRDERDALAIPVTFPALPPVPPVPSERGEVAERAQQAERTGDDGRRRG